MPAYCALIGACPKQSQPPQLPAVGIVWSRGSLRGWERRWHACDLHVVVYFDRDAEGDLRARPRKERTPRPLSAQRSLSHIHPGAVSFSRIGDPATDEFEDAVNLARLGEVDSSAEHVRHAREEQASPPWAGGSPRSLAKTGSQEPVNGA
jgi:hypothetical protein